MLRPILYAQGLLEMYSPHAVRCVTDQDGAATNNAIEVAANTESVDADVVGFSAMRDAVSIGQGLGWSRFLFLILKG
jgi:hypothetical protein